MIGQKLGSFKIEGVLGSGAMGIVYRATQETTGRAAAIKVILGDPTQKGNASERFQREAEILQQFRHPNIVRFLAVGRSGGKSYFAMEFVPGTTLDTVVRDRGTLPWAEVADLAVQLCDALQYAHEHGVVHRDLKPSNLLFSEKGRLKLTDFGIAKDLDATALTATGRTLGTAAYMAPEQIRGTPDVSHKTDLYALGILMYQMLTGALPFEGTTAVVLMHQHMNATPPRPSAKVREIPKAMDDLIVALMAKAPADRPWDAAAVGLNFQQLLEKKAKGEPIPMVWPAEGDPAGQPTRGGGPAAEKAKKARKSTTKGTREASTAFDRRVVGTAGLVLALAAVGGLIAYGLWPPGEAYLYRHAAALMESPSYTDWSQAKDEYIEPLIRRFPGHAHKAQAEAWLDQIALNAAERRAGRLEVSRENGLAGPGTEVETIYLHAFQEAQAGAKTGDDDSAARAWERLPETLKPFGEPARGYILLARRRAEAVRASMQARKAEALAMIEQAGRSALVGNVERARALLHDVVEKYAKYADLAALVNQAKASLDAPARPADPPAPAAEPMP